MESSYFVSAVGSSGVVRNPQITGNVGNVSILSECRSV